MHIRKYILSELKKAGVEEIELRAETSFILENLFNISNPYMDYDMTEEAQKRLEKVFEKRKTGLPIQYILGIADFMGEKFFVDENVLIPRQETEILVMNVLAKAKEFSCPKILDIGTGSGCIPIILSRKLKSSEIYSCDISNEAINVAQKNAKNLCANVSFFLSDIYENVSGCFDIIVSNPPYIPPSEKQTIQKEVSFEPDLALYASDAFGVEFYEKIIKDGNNHLNENGYILFELGIGQSKLVKNIFIDYNYKEIKILKDIEGKDRIICAKV